MRQRDKFEIPVEMAKVRRDIEEWRSTRTKRCRLPDWLWEAAATFGRTHGIYRTARALHVSYESLKYRVASGTGGRPTDTMRQAAVPFVELRRRRLPQRRPRRAGRRWSWWVCRARGW